MRTITGMLVAGAVLALAPAAVAADGVSAGEREFRSNCASCHGTDGQPGPYIDFLKATPTDLTMLSQNNKGVFPFQRVYEVIDGRADVKAHGPRDMPIWGIEYGDKADEYYADYFKMYDTEAFVRSRVFALIEYISSIQK